MEEEWRRSGGREEEWREGGRRKRNSYMHLRRSFDPKTWEVGKRRGK